MLFFWSSFSPWNLEWMLLLYLFHLVNSSLLAYCSICPWSVCLLGLEYFAMFLNCFHNKCGANFLSRQLDWLVPRSLHMKSGNRATNAFCWKYESHEVSLCNIHVIYPLLRHISPFSPLTGILVHISPLKKAFEKCKP